MLLIKEEQKDVKNYQHNSTYLGKWFFVIRGAFMKKINIVKEKKDFDKAFKLRNQIYSKYAYIYIKDNEAQNYRLGICVSKKLGNAVTRNLINRRVKDIIDKSKLHFANKDYIIVLKKSAVSAQYLELKEDLISVLKKFDR